MKTVPKAGSGWAFLFSWVTLQIIIGILYLLLAENHPNVSAWSDSPQAYLLGVILGLGSGLFLLLVFLRPKSIADLFDLISLRFCVKEIQIQWVLWGAVVAVIVILLLPITPMKGGVLYCVIERGRREQTMFYVTTAHLIAAFLEEPIVRGFLYKAFRESYGRVVAITIVSMLSILTQFSTLAGSLVVGTISVLGMCILLCWCFEKTRNLANCILCHLTYNVCLFTYDWLRAENP